MIKVLVTYRFRDLLVEAALRHGVVPLLLARLDWRASGHRAGSPKKSASASDAGSVAGNSADASSAAGSSGDRDEAVARVLAVDVLHLLAAEGAHAAQVGVTADGAVGRRPHWHAGRPLSGRCSREVSSC